MYDMKNLTKLAKLGELAPEAFKGFVAFDAAAFQGGVIPAKYKELMAVAVALTTQCPYCIDAYTQDTLSKGCDPEQLTEVAHVASAIKGGSALVHGLHDHKKLELEFPMYDALYAWCREKVQDGDGG